MKLTVKLLTGCIVLALPFSASATEFKTVNYGAASVVYDYQQASDEVATLSLNALVTETNDSLRGLKNSDRRRLGKMGQLIYQCKLLLRTPAKSAPDTGADTPMLVSRNYSLFTDVDLPLAAGKRLGIKVRSLQPVDGNSLFSPTLGQQNVQREVWANLGEGSMFCRKAMSSTPLKTSTSSSAFRFSRCRKPSTSGATTSTSRIFARLFGMLTKTARWRSSPS